MRRVRALLEEAAVLEQRQVIFGSTPGDLPILVDRQMGVVIDTAQAPRVEAETR